MAWCKQLQRPLETHFHKHLSFSTQILMVISSPSVIRKILKKPFLACPLGSNSLFAATNLCQAILTFQWEALLTLTISTSNSSEISKMFQARIALKSKLREKKSKKLQSHIPFLSTQWWFRLKAEIWILLPLTQKKWLLKFKKTLKKHSVMDQFKLRAKEASPKLLPSARKLTARSLDQKTRKKALKKKL